MRIRIAENLTGLNHATGVSKHLHIPVVEIFRFVWWKVFELKNKESF